MSKQSVAASHIVTRFDNWPRVLAMHCRIFRLHACWNMDKLRNDWFTIASQARQRSPDAAMEVIEKFVERNLLLTTLVSREDTSATRRYFMHAF